MPLSEPFLPGWRSSRGSRSEHVSQFGGPDMCRRCGIGVRHRMDCGIHRVHVSGRWRGLSGDEAENGHVLEDGAVV